jgi:uncharacterized protein YceK
MPNSGGAVQLMTNVGLMSMRHKNKIAAKLFMCSVPLVACCGCSSFIMHTGPDEGIYLGARTGANLIAHPRTFPFLPPQLTVPLGIIDIAPSTALDTLLLPIDLTFAQGWRGSVTPVSEVSATNSALHHLYSPKEKAND